MNPGLAHLLNRIEDEFRDRTDVRIRVAPLKVRQKSPDLEQEFDDGNWSATRGIWVRTRLKEYYFPEAWEIQNRHREIQDLVDQIRFTLD